MRAKILNVNNKQIKMGKEPKKEIRISVSEADFQTLTKQAKELDIPTRSYVKIMLKKEMNKQLNKNINE